jgi:hypothetical protein
MTAPLDDRRDPELAALLLANIDAPPLSPGFHEELEARLQAADASLTSVPARRRRPTTRRLVVAAAVAAVAAVFAFAVLPAIRGVETATASDVLAAMTAASGGAQTVRLRIVTVATGVSPAHGSYPSTQYSQTETTDLTMDISGDQLSDVTGTTSTKTGDGPWTHDPFPRVTESYDESRHESRVNVAGGSTKARFAIRRPAWLVEAQSAGDVSEEYASLSASLRAELATDPGAPVSSTTYLGRPAWSARLNEIWPANEFRKQEIRVTWDVTVDKATGLLLAATYRLSTGNETAPLRIQTRVTSIELDPALPARWQLAPLPSTGTILVTDVGTRFGTPEQVAKRSRPTLPLVPRWAPSGYRLSDLASAQFSAAALGWDIRWQPQGNGHVVRRSGRFVFRQVSNITTPVGTAVLERFRRGFGSFVVKIQPKAFGARLDNLDPTFDRPGGQDVTLTGGYLKGTQARTWISPYKGLGPTLVAFSDRSQIMIWGDLTRQELIEVANSLKVYGDVNRPAPSGGGQ